MNTYKGGVARVPFASLVAGPDPPHLQLLQPPLPQRNISEELGIYTDATSIGWLQTLIFS